MDREKYMQTQLQLSFLGGAFTTMELDEFVRAAEAAETVAPVLDPTAWIKGGELVRAFAKLGRAAIAFRAAFAEFRAVYDAHQAKEKS